MDPDRYTNGKRLAPGRRGGGPAIRRPGEVVQVGRFTSNLWFRFLGWQTQGPKIAPNGNQSNHPRQKTLLAPGRSTFVAWIGYDYVVLSCSCLSVRVTFSK